MQSFCGLLSWHSQACCSSMYFYSHDWLPRNHLFPQILGTLFGSLLNPLMEFPFNPTFTPWTFFDPSRWGNPADILDISIRDIADPDFFRD